MENIEDKSTSHDLRFFFIILFVFTCFFWILTPILSNGDLKLYTWNLRLSMIKI